MTTKHTDPQREAMGALNFKQSYARYDATKKRRENWGESVERVMAMHREHLGELADGLTDELGLIERAYKERRILGSQRSLQFGGQAILDKHPRSYNCLGEETPFITREGVKTFADYVDGDQVEVLTHTGAWRNAVVRSYGEQRLNTITIRRGGAEHKVRATANHRWLLREGGETTALTEGTTLLGAPSLFRSFNYDEADPLERLYWCYGFVYGDGTKVKNAKGEYSSSMVRLCGHASKYAERFIELGFKTSQPLSCGGDFMAYTGSYLKTAPDPTKDSPNMIRAFVAGYLAADGAVNGNYNEDGANSRYSSIQVTGEAECDFVRRCFPVAGVYIVSETDYTGQKTNFTESRPYTIRFQIYAGDLQARTTAAGFKVFSIEEGDVEKVWCLEVDDDRSFVLPFGLSTGNCTSCYVDDTKRFSQALYLLLCGAGVGYSVQRHHVAQLPNVISAPALSKMPQSTFIIEDTIEGWCDALDALVSAYFGLSDQLPSFSFALIRPEGAAISSCGGKAPGPYPLRVMLSEAERLLRSRAGQPLRPCDASDLMCIAADCVRAGGVRRSALLCMFSPDDAEMIAYKSVDQWWATHPYRARANISAMIERSDPKATQYFEAIFEKTRAYGEPATIWCESTEVAYNPCVEIGMVPLLIRDPQGEVVDEYSHDLLDPSRREQWRAKGYTFETAFQFCNLTEVNVAAWTSKREAYEAVELATILGCIQASYTLTDDDYLAGTATKAILEREYLCGVSLTGLGSAQPFARDARFLGALGAYAADTANAYFERCGLKKAPARVTCVKPSGNAAVLLGVSSGVHAEHAPRFLRRMQQPKNSPIVQAFASANPQAVENSMWSAFGTDYAVSFAIETPAGARLKTNETAEDFLRWVSAVQGGWVKNGTLRPESVEGLTHNVSNTCVVRDYEWDDVKRMLLTHRAQFGGVSCLSASGDYDYPQAPFQRVFEPHEIEETDPHREAKIAAWELWNKLRESYVEIDYDAITEEDDNTELMGEVACAGGACELTL